MKIVVSLLAAILLPASGQDAVRLARPIAMPDAPELPANAAIGQVTVDYYDLMQRRHGAAYRTMDENFVCRSGSALLLGDVARRLARALDADGRKHLKEQDSAALTALAIEVVAQLDRMDPARIHADEAIGPGVYHPSIEAVAYTIGRCHFY